MAVLSRGSYEVKVPTASTPTLRSFAFSPPIQIGNTSLPATGSLLFSF
ncbi:MAG: hypothetical protein IPK82_25335 [Polyangiaceae bacterium]|nr:hypothetical protein [Polyangiaceae bacterium]